MSKVEKIRSQLNNATQIPEDMLLVHALILSERLPDWEDRDIGFIAAAWQNVSILLAEVDQQMGEIERLRRWLILIEHSPFSAEGLSKMAHDALDGDTPVMGG